jgi:formamidopyrimidine-DNA glycosylase
MPEGDTLERIAQQLQPLVGSVPTITTPLARHQPMRLPARLAGQTLTAVEARGKHLLIRFDSGLVIHTHLRMSGRWDIGAPGRPTRRPRSTAWLVGMDRATVLSPPWSRKKGMASALAAINAKESDGVTKNFLPKIMLRSASPSAAAPKSGTSAATAVGAGAPVGNKPITSTSCEA